MNTYYGKTMDFVRGIKEVTKYQFDTYNIDPSFPAELSNLQEKDLKIEECFSRKDFRGEKAFTIDCEDCKDMDDAVSIVKTAKGYRLAGLLLNMRGENRKWIIGSSIKMLRS